jgi:kinesin family protein 2/24
MRAGNRAVAQGNQKPADGIKKKDSCLSEIQRLQRERDERRRLMEQAKRERAAEEQRNVEMGTPGDVDFMRMIRNWRNDQSTPKELPHSAQRDMKICICVRKRPISEKEIRRQDHDSVTCVNPLVVVHDCKLKVDGISKYLDNNAFQFDHTFHEDNTTDEVYMYCVQPLINFVLGGGRATVFAYGQVGTTTPSFVSSQTAFVPPTL